MRPEDLEFFRYFAVEERDRRWGLYLRGVGSARFLPFVRACPLSVHPEGYMYQWSEGRVLREYSAFYVTRGEGEFESTSAGRCRVQPGCLLMLYPGEWHRYRPDPEVGWNEYWIHFGGRCVAEWVAEGFLTPSDPVLRPGIDDAILRGYLDLLDLARLEPTGLQQLAAAKIHGILAAALTAVRRRESSSDEQRVRQAKALLEERIEGIVSIAKVAASVGVSQEHLRRLFRAHAGVSPYQYYLDLKIDRARQMLREPCLSLKEIAFMLGFENPDDFSHAFKRQTGLSPRQWRSGAWAES